MLRVQQNSVYSNTQNNPGLWEKGLTGWVSKYPSILWASETSQRGIALLQKSKSSNYRLLLVCLFHYTKGRCYFWLSSIGLQECFTMRSVRVGGLSNLKGKQALLIMKLQCNQRKSPDHFMRKHLRHINSKTKISIFSAESASTHTAP